MFTNHTLAYPPSSQKWIVLVLLVILRLIFPKPRLLSFQWKTRYITYLGTEISTHLSDLYVLNYSPLLTKNRRNLASWQNVKILWFERINILKMDILPKILDIFQTIPICVLSEFFAAPYALSYPVYLAVYLSGRVSFPDFDLYHSFALVSRIFAWFPRPYCMGSTMQALGPVDLWALPWDFGHSYDFMSTLFPHFINGIDQVVKSHSKWTQAQLLLFLTTQNFQKAGTRD